MSSVAAIQTKDLSFSYAHNLVLEKATFSIGAKEFVCIVGPNGGGKTTLLKLLLGLLKPQTGTVSIFGEPPHIARKQIGYLPQHTHLDPFFPVRVIDVVLMGRLGKTSPFGRYKKVDRDLALENLDRVGLKDLASRPLRTLSGGQRQRVLIARALVSEPRLLLLDEPTANLDDYVEHELYELLQKLNKELAIAVVTHDIAFVSSYVERVVCVNQLVHLHPTSEINENLIHDMYGQHIHAVRHDQEHRHV